MVATIVTHSDMAKPVCHGPSSCAATQIAGPRTARAKTPTKSPSRRPCRRRDTPTAGSSEINAPTLRARLSVIGFWLLKRPHIATPPPAWQACKAGLASRAMASCIALVVAAGRGTRLGGALPKQYLPLAGRRLLRYSIETLAHHPAVGEVRVVINPDDGEY